MVVGNANGHGPSGVQHQGGTGPRNNTHTLRGYKQVTFFGASTSFGSSASIESLE